jgi:Homing endonuclease associated repeat/HNH endonuclease
MPNLHNNLAATGPFQLRLQHRNIPADQLLADLRRVAGCLGVPTLTQATYRRHSQFNPLTLCQRFGGWNAALAAAGLSPSRHFRVGKKAVLDDVRRVARALRTRHLLLTQYQAEGNYSPTLIYKHFENWSNILAAAGLAASPYQPRLTDRALFENLEHIWTHLGHQPKCTDLYPPLSRYGLTPYQRRFGGWQNALIAFTQYMTARNGTPSDTQSIPAGTPILKHKTTRTISWRLRFLTLRRDNYRCCACGRSPATHPNIQLEVDHKTPWSKGGETVLENLQTLCEICNGGKSNLAWTPE